MSESQLSGCTTKILATLPQFGPDFIISFEGMQAFETLDNLTSYLLQSPAKDQATFPKPPSQLD